MELPTVDALVMPSGEAEASDVGERANFLVPGPPFRVLGTQPLDSMPWQLPIGRYRLWDPDHPAETHGSIDS